MARTSGFWDDFCQFLLTYEHSLLHNGIEFHYVVDKRVKLKKDFVIYLSV